jgi:hypothetical protein
MMNLFPNSNNDIKTLISMLGEKIKIFYNTMANGFELSSSLSSPLTTQL